MRGGDAYVHWDGATLHVADDEHLDPDDTVAQLVLHEICHALVEGPVAMRLPDWGLDNASGRDVAHEAAAVRLQAHLTGAFGLRGTLFPTTEVRALFEALPADSFVPVPLDDGAESVPMARVAALRAASDPFHPVLREALAATAALAARPVHPISGLPLGPAGATCGGCTWRTPGGFCRQAPRRHRVAREDEPACARFEGALDCLTCGACCRSAYDSVTVGPRDPVLRRHPSLVTHRGNYLELRREGDRCAALTGPIGGPFTCTIYDDRPRCCRDFENGGRHCLEARRRVGLTF
ncbi:MAG: YkgJ family cysteine cluster protein [Myxococcales bacterium]|nr:YkgJ family cysteine cluster protein [Myxococcales bacterium]